MNGTFEFASDSQRLLELVEELVVEHGGDLGGWTRLLDDALQLFDGQVTLRVEMKDAGPSARDGVVHAHILSRLQDDEEELDACLFGLGNDHDAALRQAAAIWVTGVAGPIKSFLDNAPVCLSCQVGVQGGDLAEGFLEEDYGLTGLHAFVGPSIARFSDDDQVLAALDKTTPWFRFAAESAAPRRVHLAKTMLISKGKNGWRRELEVDGHDVSHSDPDWPVGVHGPEFAYLTRYAVFAFPRNSREILRRTELERTIRHFAENYVKHDSVDHLMNEMLSLGFDPDLVHETEAFATIAFGRTLFEPHGLVYSPTIIRARQDGRVETDVPLMSIPAYARARAIAVQLRETMPGPDFQALCLYNAESNSIIKAMESHGDRLDLSKMKLFPCVVPDRNVDDRTMTAALESFQATIERNRTVDKQPKKPWWKFW